MNKMRPHIPEEPSIGVVGATGAVGLEILRCVEKLEIPCKFIRLFASSRSVGKRLSFKDNKIVVEALDDRSFEDLDFVFFASDSSLSREFIPVAVKTGVTVIDNSSAYRMDDSVPLVVPEVNAKRLCDHQGIIANPNCIVAIMLCALSQIYSKLSIRGLQISTYQAASGAGLAAMEELRSSTNAFLKDEPHVPEVFPHPYAFNFFSHDSDMDDTTLYNGEELKVIEETRKILALDELPISVTCIRVPVLRAHGISISVKFDDPVTTDAVCDILANTPGVKIVNDNAAKHFPMPSEATGKEDVLVGRIRRDIGDNTGKTISLFVVGDQLLKGAALNAAQIAERLIQDR